MTIANDGRTGWFCRDKANWQAVGTMVRITYAAKEWNCSARVHLMSLSSIWPFAIMCMSSMPFKKSGHNENS